LRVPRSDVSVSNRNWNLQSTLLKKMMTSSRPIFSLLKAAFAVFAVMITHRPSPVVVHPQEFNSEFCLGPLILPHQTFKCKGRTFCKRGFFTWQALIGNVQEKRN
jgi:hypothetical protein